MAEYLRGAVYPDDNCNIEIYTCSKFFEIETLSPVYTFLPGEKYIHTEKWLIVNKKVPVSGYIDYFSV